MHTQRYVPIFFSTSSSTRPTPLLQQWFKHVIFNDTNYDFKDFGVEDIEIGVRKDPGGISAFSGDMADFKARGGKLLTYHGRRDEVREVIVTLCALFR